MPSSARWCLYHPLVRNVRLASGTVSAPRPPAQNLGERYRTLENTARGRTPRAVSLGAASPTKAGPVPAPTTTDTIAGFVIPKEPRAPADDECCMSGCAVCVYDLYEEALATYKVSVKTLRAALSVRHIPETEWPAHIGTAPSPTPTTMTTVKTRGAVFDAFEEMERALKEKRDRRAAVEAEKRARGDVLAGDGERISWLDLRGLYEGIKWILFPNR